MAEKQDISITTDSVVLSKTDGKMYVLLIQRKNDPYKHQWALPGGFLEDTETLSVGAQRELEEETGLKVDSSQLRQVGVYAKPDRDPRGRIISIAFTVTLNTLPKIKGKDDAKNATWFPLKTLPELAFDHSEIIHQAVKLK